MFSVLVMTMMVAQRKEKCRAIVWEIFHQIIYSKDGLPPRVKLCLCLGMGGAACNGDFICIQQSQGTQTDHPHSPLKFPHPIIITKQVKEHYSDPNNFLRVFHHTTLSTKTYLWYHEHWQLLVDLDGGVKVEWDNPQGNNSARAGDRSCCWSVV